MHLNLARKWRSQHFDEIVGQQLVVRLVKNSLYRNLIFPVYLLSGTRGCGKTSIGRIFAAALNCQALEQFQKNPQNQQIPCLVCASCRAMQVSKHPDFIEIDAASHTGVDNVRAIIDASAFVPVLGSKKIYLIDEAHMLSKAAFNAFLKILEEPPLSVVFLLATTDPHKILETVTSRCFQLFFEPIESCEVVEHLARICLAEAIPFEKEALILIAQETEGSMRDALNLVERVRIAYPSITQTSVIELLGKIDDERLCELLRVVLYGSGADVLGTIHQMNLKNYAPTLVWKSFVELIRLSLWVKNGVDPQEGTSTHVLREITKNCSLDQLLRLFELCYEYELAFAKTATPECMLEMMLLKMAQNEQPKNPRAARESRDETRRTSPIQESAPDLINKAEQRAVAAVDQESKAVSAWDSCLQEIEKLHDPLVVSIFKQGVPHACDAQNKRLEVTFSQDLLFFKEWLVNTQKVWQPIINRFFSPGVELVPHFTGPAKERVPKAVEPVKLPGRPVPQNTPLPSKKERIAAQKVVTITDTEKWQKAHALLRVFPGTLSVSQENPESEGV